MSLSKLNHDCFHGVPAACPLSKQLLFRLVSTSWCTAIESQMRHRPSLAVLDSNYPVTVAHYKEIPRTAFYFVDDPLLLRKCDNPCSEGVLRFLSHHFPSLKKVLLFLDTQSFPSLDGYLRQLSHSLTTLAILNDCQVDWTQLRAISRCTRLFCWKMTDRCVPNTEPTLQGADCRLAHLQYLATCFVFGYPLAHVGSHLRWLHLDDIGYLVGGTAKFLFWEFLLQLKVNQARTSLQHLSIGRIGCSSDTGKTATILEALCEAFHNLKSLHLLDKWIPLEVIVSSVRKCPKLTKLVVLRATLEKAIEGGFDSRKWPHMASIKIVPVEEKPFDDCLCLPGRSTILCACLAHT